MSELVRVPRAMVTAYCSLPWSDVLAAAKTGRDGLSVAGPTMTPWPWDFSPPIRSNYSADDKGADAFTRAEAEYLRDRDHCYLHDGAGRYDKGRCWLFQQNWSTLSARPLSTDPAVVAEWEKARAVITA